MKRLAPQDTKIRISAPQVGIYLFIIIIIVYLNILVQGLLTITFVYSH